MNRPVLYLLSVLTACFPVIGLTIFAGTPGSAWAASGSGSGGTPDDDIEEDIEDDVEEDIEEDIEDDIEDDVEDDIEDDIEDDVESDIEDDIEDDVEDDVESDIEDDVEDDVESGVESRIEDNITDKIDDKVEDNSGSGNAADRDLEQDVEESIESKIEDKGGSGDRNNDEFGEGDLEELIASDIADRSGSGGDEDAQFDEAKALAKAEFDAARAVADAERDAARAAARAARNAALALPGADKDAIDAAYDLAKNAADDGRDDAREEAETTYASALSVIKAADDDEDDNDGSSNSGSGSSNSGHGGRDEDEDEDDDEDEDEDDDEDDSGKGLSNSGSGSHSKNSSTSDGVFDVALDDDGNEISKGEWLMLASPSAVAILSEKGFAATEIDRLDGLNLVLARVESSDRFSIAETEAAIRDAAPEAKVDFNHVYYRHDYRPGTQKTRRKRHGEAPAALYDFPNAGGGAGLSVGIIDTNVDTTHVSLKNAHVRLENFVSYEHTQPEAHGTSVASILAGDSDDYHGLLPKAEVFAASVFFNSPTGSESATTMSLVRALDWMTENNVSVVNMSLTGPPNEILKSAIDRAYEKGTIVVAAVGNAGPTAPPLYPAAYDNVVAVTAVTKSNRIYRLANRGDHVDFAAPGVNVLHAEDHGTFAASTGTSMAAPFVTAILAASCDEEACVTAEMLSEFAAQAKDLGRKGFDPIYGNGLIRPLKD